MKTCFFSILIMLFSSLIWSGCEKKADPEFSVLNTPSGEHASLPFLTVDAEGNLYFSWVEKPDSISLFFYSKLNDSNEWSKPKLVASGNDWFVNWADYPMIHVPGKEKMIGHFLQKSSEDTYSYNVMVITSDLKSWNDPFKLHNDTTLTEHGFVSYATSIKDQKTHLFWLDGRNTTGHHSGAMTLRTASFDQANHKIAEHEIDETVCDCCQTTAVMSAVGPVVFYRNRSEFEIRDIYYSRLIDSTWTVPKPIHNDNWQINGCPVNGPRAFAQNNTIVVAWYSAANNKPEVKIAFSHDNGETFQSPIVVDNQNPLGRVDIVLEDEKTAIVSWLASDQKDAVISVARIKNSGEIMNSVKLNKNSGSRGIGFPQLEKYDDQYFIAYTKIEEAINKVEIVSVNF